MQLTSAACTHIGRRNQNEDSLLVDSRLGLFAVADGMGGQAGGEVASKLAVGAVRDVYSQVDDRGESTMPIGIKAALGYDEGLAEAAVRRANQSICSHRQGLFSQMGSTLALMTVRDGKVVMAHVGDSRIYRLRDGDLTLLTSDHSFYNALIAAGITDLPPRSKFPYNNIITRCLGDPKKAVPDLRVEDARAGDVYLLCTDGLVETLSDGGIRDILSSLPPNKAVHRLVREAYNEGGCDNITAVCVRLEPDRPARADEPDDEHPHFALSA